MNDEFIFKNIEEKIFSNVILQILETLQRKEIAPIDMMVEIHLRGLYKEILKIAITIRLIESYSLEIEAMINIKY